MRPKSTPFKKKEAVKRKNRGHWSTHKDEITAKRALRNVQLDQSQIFTFDNHDARISTADDLAGNSSVRVSTNDEFDVVHNDNINDHFSNEHADEMDDDDVAFYNTSDNFIANVDKEEAEDNSDEIEDDLTEEQMKFADEFINVDISSMSIREYDELVSKELPTQDSNCIRSISGCCSYIVIDQEKTQMHK